MQLSFNLLNYQSGLLQKGLTHLNGRFCVQHLMTSCETGKELKLTGCVSPGRRECAFTKSQSFGKQQQDLFIILVGEKAQGRWVRGDKANSKVP